MFIELHGLNVSLRPITHDELIELTELLGIPLHTFKRIVNKKYQTLALHHTFPHKEYSPEKVKQSVYIQLGKFERSWSRSINGDVIYDDDQIPKFQNVRFALHGSFFDNSPDFDCLKLWHWLAKRSHSITQTDIAYCDDQQVTTIDQWTTALGHYKENCIGNFFLKGKARNVGDGDYGFDSYQIGSASSKTCYATFYKRPNGLLRFENKYILKEYATTAFELIAWHTYEPENTDYTDELIQMLVNQINIVTPQSKELVAFTRNNSKYSQAAFYKEFLNSKIDSRTPKQKKIDTRNLSDTEIVNQAVKRIVGNILGLVSRTSPDDELTIINAIVEKINPLYHVRILEF